MEKRFKVSQVRELLNQVYNEKISFSRFVEILNEQSKGDVRQKESVKKVTPFFLKETTFVEGWAAVYPNGLFSISPTKEDAENYCDENCLGVIYINSELILNTSGNYSNN